MSCPNQGSMCNCTGACLKRLNPDDLLRLGIPLGGWLEHQQKLAREQSYTVRVVGGIDVLREALRDIDHEISEGIS